MMSDAIDLQSVIDRLDRIIVKLDALTPVAYKPTQAQLDMIENSRAILEAIKRRASCPDED